MVCAFSVIVPLVAAFIVFKSAIEATALPVIVRASSPPIVTPALAVAMSAAEPVIVATAVAVIVPELTPSIVLRSAAATEPVSETVKPPVTVVMPVKADTKLAAVSV